MLFTTRTAVNGSGKILELSFTRIALLDSQNRSSSAENVIDADFIHCLCIDSGNFKTLSLDKIRTLPNQFRKMPKLAMKGKLHGEYRDLIVFVR